MPEDLTHPLPERYAPLLKYVSTKFPEQTSAFDSTFRLIESRRLLEAQKLRKTLQSYWSATNEELQNRSPIDIVYCFQVYAETFFRAVGEICLGLFHNPELYGAFLDRVREWIVETIFPEPATSKESQTELLAVAENTLECAERMGCSDHFPVRKLAAFLRNLNSAIPDPTICKDLRFMIDRTMIIDLRESFSAFEARRFRGKTILPSGDWGSILHYSVWDVMLTGRISLRAQTGGFETVGALNDAMNREVAQLIWTIALEQLQDALLSSWWAMSADSRALDTNLQLADAEPEIQCQLESDGSPAGDFPKVSRHRSRHKITDSSSAVSEVFADERHKRLANLLNSVIAMDGLESFLAEYPELKRTSVMDYKAGRLKGKVSPEKRAAIEAAILASAAAHGLFDSD